MVPAEMSMLDEGSKKSCDDEREAVGLWCCAMGAIGAKASQQESISKLPINRSVDSTEGS
jgi:hypothetical protein